MTLLRIKYKDTANLKLLYRLVLKHIYDPRGQMDGQPFSPADRELMETSFENWKSKLDYDRDMGTLDEYEEEMIMFMAKLLVMNEEGKLNRKKRLYKEHKIDYRKAYKLREAYTREGLAKAKAMKDEYDRQNPEQEDMGHGTISKS